MSKQDEKNRESYWELKANVGDGIRDRFQAFKSGGYDFADNLHDIYLDYGYPAELDFFNFWNMYRRLGIAKNIVETYPELGWMDSPLVLNNDEPISDIEILNDNFGLWTRLKGLDTRQRVGRYAGLFMRVRDGLTPDKPIGNLNGLNSLVDMIPLYESQLEVVSTQNDIMADDYGYPTMYQFNGTEEGNRNENALSTFNIHPSRLIMASEGSDNGSIYGVSCLEAVYNSLMDLRKVIGGGAEGFYKNAAQSIVYSLKDGASAAVNEDILEKFNENADDFLRNRARRSQWIPGMDAKVLDSNLANPKDFFMNALHDVSSGVKIPATILMGQQLGRLASDQDSKALLSRVQSRRVHFQTEIVTKTINWLMDNSIVTPTPFNVEWPDALAASTEEKLENGNKMAEINQKLFLSGNDPAFDGEEVREISGFDPRELEDIPDETLEDEAE